VGSARRGQLTGHRTAVACDRTLPPQVQDSFTVSEIFESAIGPVVGTQAGPGCPGGAIFQPTEEEQPLSAPVTDAW
jgi:hypothetical protein